jgi:hypothetical protein
METKGENVEKAIIALEGASFSGSTAISNYLGGTKSCFDLGKYFEFDFVRQRGGLFDLYLSYLDTHYNLKHGALNRFVSYIDFHKDYYSYFDKIMGLEGNLIKTFNSASEIFLQKISSNTFYGYIRPDEQGYINRILSHTQICAFPDPSIREFIINIMLKIVEKIKKNTLPLEFKSQNHKQYTPENISKEKFLSAAQEYLNSIFSAITQKEKIAMVCTHSYFSQEADLFFPNLKIVFVTRDPRDVYSSMSYRVMANDTNRNVLRSYGYPMNDDEYSIFVKSYIRSHKIWRNYGGNIKFVRFEDFVLDHEKTTNDLCEYLDISKENMDTSTYDIGYSKTRVGLWKSYLNQKVMEKIASELKDYLYES